LVLVVCWRAASWGSSGESGLAESEHVVSRRWGGFKAFENQVGLLDVFLAGIVQAAANYVLTRVDLTFIFFIADNMMPAEWAVQVQFIRI